MNNRLRLNTHSLTVTPRYFALESTCVVWMLAAARLGRRVSVSKGLVGGFLSAVRARMASSSVSLKEEVETLRKAVKEQVGGRRSRHRS